MPVTKKSQLFIVVIIMPFYLILSIFCYTQQNQDSATILLILQFYFIVIFKSIVLVRTTQIFS